MKISVITPCYNSEKTIERTIQSVISQNYDNIEYLIIDGLSKDSTVSILENYSNKYSFIKYISEKDNSMTEALNKGFKLSTGDIVCTVNADDEFEINAFNRVVSEFKRDLNLDVVIGNTKVITERTQNVVFTTTPKYFSNLFLLSILDCPTPECSVFSKRASIKSLGFYDENIKYTQDYDLYLKVVKNKFNIKYIDFDLSKFYLAESQYSIAAKDKMMEEVLSYVPYKKTHKLLRSFRINGLIRTFLGLRRYENFNKFKMHLLNKHL